MTQRSPGARRSRAGARAWRPLWRGLERGSRRLCLVTAVGTAMLGALFGSAFLTMVVAPAAGLFAAGQVALMRQYFPTQTSARRVAALTGAGCALVVPFTVGATSLGTAGAVLTMTVLLTGAVVLAGRLTDPGREAGAPPSWVEGTMVRGKSIGAVPMSVLLDEWRLSEAVLAAATGPEERSAAATARQLLLTEMTRRDPAGVQRWLAEGADGSPGRHLRDDAAPGG